MTSNPPEVDHVVLGVADLDSATAWLAEQGLTALPGGTHPHWGTANRIVPLGSAYSELVAVVDPAVAATSAFGSWIAAQARGDAAWGWAVRPHDIAATAERLDLDLVPGSRVRPDGVTCRGSSRVCRTRGRTGRCRSSSPGATACPCPERPR